MNDLPRIRKESGVFTVEVDKIKPNTMQPRSEFNEEHLKQLSDSIRQYGVLQPLIVIRHEKDIPTGSVVEYELIAGERRWRASKLAGLQQVPVIIREDPSEQVKLELALIENIQREDLGPVERAEAFAQLIDNFKMRHHEVGAKMGKSREFVSNTLRLLTLPDEIKDGLRQGLISEGHTRPLLSLKKQKDEQMNLYREIIFTKMNVREAERMAREIVQSYKTPRVKPLQVDPEEEALQVKLTNVLGAKVSVQKRGPVKKKISFEFDSDDQLAAFLAKVGAMNSEIVSKPEMESPAQPEVANCVEKEEPCESCEYSPSEPVKKPGLDVRLAGCTTCTPESSPSLQEEAEEIIRATEIGNQDTPQEEQSLPEVEPENDISLSGEESADPTEFISEPDTELASSENTEDEFEAEEDQGQKGNSDFEQNEEISNIENRNQEREDDEETSFFSMF